MISAQRSDFGIELPALNQSNLSLELLRHFTLLHSESRHQFLFDEPHRLWSCALLPLTVHCEWTQYCQQLNLIFGSTKPTHPSLLLFALQFDDLAKQISTLHRNSTPLPHIRHSQPTPSKPRSTPFKMSSATDRTTHQCSECSQPARKTCKACRATPNATDGKPSSTWYCSADCQKAHWAVHKTLCKDAQTRQALYRAGSLAREIFYRYAKTSFMWNPGRIEKIGTTWLIHDAVYTVTSLLFPFPYALFPDVLEQEALLTHQSCNTAVSDMHNVVKALLRGSLLLRHSSLVFRKYQTNSKQASVPKLMKSVTLSRAPNTI